MDRAVAIMRHLTESEEQQRYYHLDIISVEGDAAQKGAASTDSDDEDGSDKDSGDSTEVAYAGEVDVQVTYNPETKEYLFSDFLNFPHVKIPPSLIFPTHLHFYLFSSWTYLRSNNILLDQKISYELGAVPHQLSFDQGFFYTIRAIEMVRNSLAVM